MLGSVARVVIAFVACPLLGVQVGRLVGGLLAPMGRGEVLGWYSGLALGLVYAALIVGLVLARQGRPRVSGDLVLAALGLLAVAMMAAQLLRVELPWAAPVMALAYGAGLAIVLRRLGTAPRNGPVAQTRRQAARPVVESRGQRIRRIGG